MTQPPLPPLKRLRISPTPDTLDRLLEAAQKRKRGRVTRLVAAASLVAIGLSAGLGLPHLIGSRGVTVTGEPSTSTQPTPTETPSPRETRTPTPPPSGLPTVQGSTIDVPLVQCPTTYGSPSDRPSPAAVTMKVKLPPGLVGKVAAYSDGHGNMTLLGPLGWKCIAVDAEDGVVRVIVTPSQDANGLTPPPESFMPDNREAIAGFYSSACAACRYTLYCSILPNLVSQQDMTNFGPCHAPPGSEKLLYRSSSLAVFYDPPSVRGNGAPSGGPYPAEGAVIHHPPTPLPGDDAGYAETCTVPSTYDELCNAVLFDFIQRWT